MTSPEGLTPDAVASVTVLWEDEIDGVLAPYIAEVYQGSATSVAVGLVDAFPNAELPGVPLVADEFAVTYMKTVHNRLVGVGNELWEDIRNEVVDGIQQGQSIDQIAARITNVAQFDQVRSQRIARTEVHSAAEAGSVSQVKFVGYEDDEVEKEWISTHDLRTRESHSFVSGQRVPLNDKFIVGGSKLDYPGDFTGPADEIINCRCTTIMHIEEAPKFRCAPAIVAAAPASATQCVCPSPTIDLSAYDSATRQKVVKAFKQSSKVTPAYGGAAIHKAAEDVIANVQVPDLDVWETLAMLDEAISTKGAFNYISKYKLWFDSPAGKKTVGNAPGPHTHVTAPISQAPTAQQAVSAPAIPQLPAIAAKPGVGDIQFTGKTLGSHGAQVWVNPSTGDRWLFKPQAEFLTDLDVAMAKLQSKALVTRPAIYKTTLNGQSGSLQYMFKSSDAWPNGSFDPLKLTPQEIAILQREQIFDWMISNHDTHTGQWIRLQDGQVYGTDKGQAFKFFGKDELSWNYVPVTPLGNDKLTYTAMWKAFVAGKNVNLTDPTQGQLGEFIDRLTSIPDAEYRALLHPYALQVKSGKAVDDFLDAAVARKNSLKSDFAAFWAKAQKARSQSTGVAPPVVQPTIAKAAPTIGDPGDISGFDPFFKSDVLEMWIAQGGGKKVTPAWGGAKIFKLLVDLEKGVNDPQSGMSPATHLQLLRILDEQGGFTGKPKTYEGETLNWLASPQSTNTLLKLGLTEPPDSLKPGVKTLITPMPSTPQVKPIIPVSQAVPDDAADALADPGNKMSTGTMWQELHKYVDDEVVAYIKTTNGDTLRLTKQTSASGAHVVSVYVRKDSLGKTTWDWDGIAKNATQLVTDWNLPKPVGIWSVKTAKSVAPGKSIIPGKGPGDVVSVTELNAAKFQWPKGVIATDEDANTLYKLESDGQGGFIASWTGKNQPNNWISSPVKPDAHEQYLAKFMNWKLTGAVKPATKPSIITAQNAGDVVTPTDIWFGSDNVKVGDTVAYAKSTHPTEILKIQFSSDAGKMSLWSKIDQNNPWVQISEFDTETMMSWHTKGYTWYAAHLDGSMPDQFKVLIPGSNVPGAKATTKWTGKYVFTDGEDIPDYVWTDLTHIKSMAWDNGDIIAKGTDLSAEYRLFYFGGQLFQEINVNNVGWSSPTKIMVKPYSITWKATTGKVAKNSNSWNLAQKASIISKSAAAGKKAAKKAKLRGKASPVVVKKVLTGTDTHIPGKTTNDTLGWSEKKLLIDHVGEYVDGTIVATGKNWSGAFRLIAVDVTNSQGNVVTKLVQQKQTKTGTWTSTKFIDNEWSIDFSSFKLSNDAILPQHLLNIKKAWNKKNAPKPPTPPTKSTLPGKQATSLNVTPFQLQHVDLSPWNDSEQEEIFQFFRGKNLYTSSSSEQIWSGVQSVKSHFAQKGGKYLKLTEVEILRMVDARSAAKHGVVDSHPFEAKIVQWLKTPSGNAFVNKRIDAPIVALDVPVPMAATIDRALMDKETYRVISLSEAVAARQDSHKKYGAYTATQKAAIKKYTGGVYSSWNAAIRSGNLGSYRQDIIDAQNGMRPSTRPMILHRGTSFAELNDPGIHDCASLKTFVGRTYINRGFNSTSVGGSAAFGGQLLIEFRAPTGTPMTHVADFSHHKSEKETLLPAHLVYEILSVECANSYQTKMTVLVLGPATP